MQTRLYPATLYLLWLTVAIINSDSDAPAAEDRFEIRVLEGPSEIAQPYTLISGNRYRLQAVSPENTPIPAAWFLSGNLGRITVAEQTTLTAVFVGIGELICRIDGIEQRVGIRVVPAKRTIGSRGGHLQSPTGAEINVPKDALDSEEEIGIAIVASPGPPPTAKRSIQVIQISPTRFVLKRTAQLTFRFGSDILSDPKPQPYFWEPFGRKWMPLQGRVDPLSGRMILSINHFGTYALMTAMPEDLKPATALQIQKVTLSPRVFFAPDTHRLTIAYRLNAAVATQAFVTMDIFDLRGRRVRRLLENAPRYTGPNVAQWDGLTDSGNLVRNGRYFLLIHAKTGTQQTTYRKLIVVFK